MDGVTYFSNQVSSANTESITLTGTPAQQTSQLQGAINRASNKSQGGVVRLRAGEYRLTQVDLKSNTRLEIHPDTTLLMMDRVLFSAGRDATNLPPQLENIEVTSTHPTRKFTIDVNNQEIFKNAIPFRIGFVRNFALSNVHIEDNYSIFPSIFLVADSDTRTVANNQTYDRVPEGGVIQNVTVDKVAAGYALVQLFSGTKVLMRDLSAQGGLTIRLEPGSGRPSDYLNQAGQHVGTIKKIRMQNIHNGEGMAAVFLKPHQKIMRDIHGTNITASDSAFAVMSNSSDSDTFTRGWLTNTRFDGVIRLDRTNNLALADIGPSSQYFVTRSEREGRTKLSDFPRDPSQRRWETKPIAPVLMASALNSGSTGSRNQGRYAFDIDSANIQASADLPLERPERVLYREDALRLNGSIADEWINK
ncbi:hypothetical protein [Microbulbifer elongatus]|uniref:hypothetical protein n=1 Tax=Microbulbifer elongatus TaxID=86173 RepID=UPI001CFDEB70|nr:hypothetical protein [Microbulbifer elongatus]